MVTNTHRRRLPLAIASVVTATLALAGCSAAEPPQAQSTTRTVEHALGTAEIPVDPQRIVAIDEYAAMNLLAVGIVPDVVYETFDAAVSPVVFEHLDLETRSEPTFLMEPDYEQVSTDAPDLIVMSAAGPLTGNVADFERIAPTVALTFNEGWRASLAQTAQIFGAEEKAEKIQATLEKNLTDLASSLPADQSISVMLDYDGTTFYPTPGAAMSQLLEELGLERPAAQLDTSQEIPNEYIAPISAEQLPAHDSEWMAILAHGAYDAEAVRANPLFGSLGAQDFDIDGEMWFGSSPFSMWWMLSDLKSVIVESGTTSTSNEAAKVWDDYAAAVLGS